MQEGRFHSPLPRIKLLLGKAAKPFPSLHPYPTEPLVWQSAWAQWEHRQKPWGKHTHLLLGQSVPSHIHVVGDGDNNEVLTLTPSPTRPHFLSKVSSGLEARKRARHRRHWPAWCRWLCAAGGESAEWGRWSVLLSAGILRCLRTLWARNSSVSLVHLKVVFVGNRRKFWGRTKPGSHLTNETL